MYNWSDFTFKFILTFMSAFFLETVLFFFVMYLSPLTSQVYLLISLFSKFYITFILQWIAFIFGRHEEEDQ